MSALGRPGGAHIHERGVALVMVLWLTILLTVIGGAFAFSMRSEALASRNGVSLAQVRAAADGGIERTAFELMRPRTLQAWKPDGVANAWRDGEIGIVASARDESAKIDLNTAAEPLLKGMFVNLAGLTDERAAALVEAIADWRDVDDLRRPNGAEAADYRAADAKYVPANGPFETVSELSRVLGVTPAIFAIVSPVLTVHSRQAGINPLTAERSTLISLPAATPELVDAYIRQREEALAQKLAVPPFPPVQGFVANAGPVWRIRTEATAADGVTFVREAVVRATADPRRPFYVLLWSEGERSPPPSAAAPATAAAPSTPAAPNTQDDARRS
jgi:general secretion pathway protein K